MRTILILSLLVLGCVHAAPVATPTPAPVAAAPAKEAPAPAPLPNRAIAIVQLANHDVQCADLRRPGDTFDSAACLMPGGALVWVSASASGATLDFRVVADAPPKKTEDKPAETKPEAVKGTATSAKAKATKP